MGIIAEESKKARTSLKALRVKPSGVQGKVRLEKVDCAWALNCPWDHPGDHRLPGAVIFSGNNVDAIECWKNKQLSGRVKWINLSFGFSWTTGMVSCERHCPHQQSWSWLGIRFHVLKCCFSPVSCSEGHRCNQNPGVSAIMKFRDHSHGLRHSNGRWQTFEVYTHLVKI